MKLFGKLFKRHSPSEEIRISETDRAKVYSAYEALTEAAHKKKITKAELGAAMEEAIGYLGEVLE